LDDVVAHYGLAAAYAQKGKASQALESLRKAIELNPKNKGGAAQDKAFDSLRANPEFKRLVGP
jgi:tetratricopeptide (TPR) repeat protein